MKNIANADRPKSVGAMLPPRPLRRSGKVAQTACNSDRREGKSCIPTLNQTFADSRILKISKFRTLRIAAKVSDVIPLGGFRHRDNSAKEERNHFGVQRSVFGSSGSDKRRANFVNSAFRQLDNRQSCSGARRVDRSSLRTSWQRASGNKKRSKVEAAMC